MISGVAKLGEVAEFLDSRRKPVKESERIEGPYPYYGANGQQGWINGFLFDEPLILLAEDGGHFDNPKRGIAYAISGKSWVNNHAHVLRPRNGTDFRYLLHALKNRDVRKYITGSTRAKLTKDGASRIEIPVPPLDEQRRIAAILDQAEELRAKRRAAIALLDQLPQAIFLEMFGDPISNPLGYSSGTLSEYALQITDGEHQTPKRQTTGIKLLSARNIKDGYLDFSDVDHVGDDEYARISKRCDPKRGDILISCSGTIGRVADVTVDEPLSLVRSAALVRPKSKIIETQFLVQLLRTPALRRRMIQRANASSQANLFQNQIRDLPAILPPISLQLSFGERVEAIQRSKAAHQSALTELNALFASLQSKAFSGELSTTKELTHV